MTPEPSSSFCPICCLEKPRHDFGVDTARRWGIRRICRLCITTRWNEGKAALKGRVQEKGKRCYKCKQRLPASAFWPVDKNADGLSWNCRACKVFSVDGLKVCRDCKVEKPRDDFYQLETQRPHIASVCKPCLKARRARYARTRPLTERQIQRRVAWEARDAAKAAKIAAREAATKRRCAFCLEARPGREFKNVGDTICAECLPMVTAISMGKAGRIGS